MALSTAANKVTHNGNGVATSFAFTFPVHEATHLSVNYTDTGGNAVTLSPSLYSVTGIGVAAGGSVTYPLSGPPLANGETLTILRTVPLTQTTVLSNQGGYYPEVVERRLDNIYMALQQLDEEIGRATLDPPSAQRADIVATLEDLKALTHRPAAALMRTGQAAGNPWVFQTGDRSANVTADPEEGIWAAPNSDATGASGAWKRIYVGWVSVDWFGATGDGVTNDSAAVQAAGSGGRSFYFTPGKDYVVGGVTLTNSQIAVCSGARLFGAVGSAFIFKLTGYSPKVRDFYVADSLNCSTAAFIIDTSEQAALIDGDIWNAVNCIKLQAASGANARPKVSNVNCRAFSGTAVEIGPDCMQSQWTQCTFQAGTLNGKPKAGSIGVKMDGTGYTLGKGGHCFTQVLVLDTETGWDFVDAELTKLTGCLADTISGYGIKLRGPTRYMDIDGMFIGTCGRGILAEGTSNRNKFTGLRTILQGIIPPFGPQKAITNITQANPAVVTSASHGFPNGTLVKVTGVVGMTQVNNRWFTVANAALNSYELSGIDSLAYTAYSSGGNASDFFTVGEGYDVVMDNTALLTIDVPSWKGSSLIHYNATTALLSLDGALRRDFTSAGTVAAGVTTYMGWSAVSTTENDTAWVVPYDGYLTGFYAASALAPGAAQTFDYVLRKNGADIAIASQSSGTGGFGGLVAVADPVAAFKGDIITVKIVTSGGATATRHRGYFEYIRRGG